jgi:hypothetical protein
LLLPEEAREVTYEPGGYVVGTRVIYAPTTRRLHLAFWDFKGLRNADAITRVRAEAQATRGELASTDFVPASVTGFDMAGFRAAVQRAMASPEVRAILGKKVSEVQAWLGRFGPTLDQGARSLGIEAQEQLLQTVYKCEDFIWELKLAELLSSL